MRKIGEAGPAPMEYIEMRILPREGWPYSEIKKLSLAERALLFAMLEQEADPIYRPVER
jgi:hypothetical protein